MSHEHVLGLMIYVIFEKKVVIKIVRKKLLKIIYKCLEVINFEKVKEK